ncbi:hypothetical protein KKB11_00180, partial [Candidatus Micrarchaeota archaeon]|nr:hypothetical protein [Candidatus Micrarchaeota archaeon]
LYLKYFNQLNSRILLVIMMLLITYINLTTLYISLAVFGFFVFLFFFKNAISRKAYFTDIIILFLFIVLVGTYSTSIDLFGLAGSFSDVQGSISDVGGNVQQEIIREEDLSSKVNPLEIQKSGLPPSEELVPEEKFLEIPFLRRFIPFINNYIMQFGLEQLVLKLLNYFLLSVLVLTVFFLFPDKKQIFVFSIAIFFLVLFLIHLQFQDGVHATLELTSLVMGVCIVLVFYRKPLYFIPLILLFISSISAPVLFASNQYGESAELFASEFSSKELIGKNLVTVTMSGSFGSKEYLSNSGFVVSCVDQKPFEFYLNGIYLRCDDFSRMPLGKKIYDSGHSKVYLVLAEDLAKFK